MEIYHTPGNLLILPLNILHLFLYLDRRRGAPLRFVAGVVLLLLPWFVGYYGYMDVPTPGWLLPAVILSPLYCLPIFVYFLFDAPWRRVLMATGFVVTFSGAAQTVCLVVARGLFAVESAGAAMVATQLAVYAVLFPVLARYTRGPVRRAMDALERERLYFLILVPMVVILGASMLELLYAAPGRATSPLAVAPLLATLVFYAQLYYFMALRKRYWGLESRLEAEAGLLPVYEQYARELSRREEAVARQRHDFRHVLGQLAVLAQEEGASGLAQRIRGMVGVEEGIVARRHSANSALNAVLSFYFSRGEANGTRCRAELSVPETLPFPDAEMAVIVGNALDNAVKATRPLGAEGWIRVSARVAGGCLVFRFSNNYVSGTFGKGQGLGLASIRMLCGRYAGMLETEEGDGSFALTVALALP